MGKAGSLFGFNHSADLEKQLNNGKYFYILNHKHKTMKYMVDHGCIKLNLSSILKKKILHLGIWFSEIPLPGSFLFNM